MVKYTENYNLKKPEGSDNFSVLPYNENMDTLDSKIRSLETASNEIQHQLTTHLDEYATKSDVTFYVDATSGNDNNDGLTSGTAFKTINKAINSLPSQINHNVRIFVATGEYNESVAFAGYSGKGTITISGDASSKDRVIGNIVVGQCSIFIKVEGITFKGINIDAIECLYSSYVWISACKVDTPSSFSGVKNVGSKVVISSSLISNRGIAILAGSIASSFSYSCIGENNIISLKAQEGSIIAKGGLQPSGNTAEFVESGGEIR